MPDLGYIGAHVQESYATWACRMVVERGSAEGGGEGGKLQLPSVSETSFAPFHGRFTASLGHQALRWNS